MRPQRDVSRRILRSVAQRERCDVADLDPLHSAVDPGVLNDLVASQAFERFEFTYQGYEIVVTSGGQIQITSAP